MVYSASMTRLLARFPVTLLAMVSLASLHASSPSGSDARAHDLIKELHLSELPKESGYLGLIGESAHKVAIDGRPLAVQSQVYYLLAKDRPIRRCLGQALLRRNPMGDAGESSCADRTKLDSLGRPGCNWAIPARSRSKTHIH